ncbi:hypothetical protein J2S59_000203 [Nocardioides massiliensis]|uniref:Uncharacterized protein n=1 Tax=Nocardioides massiliensis TaxID=1325935 RepID=A0ABT9NJJ3_9ACTN|nr:hypothetical protein [Nocardioides massiliensis]
MGADDARCEAAPDGLHKLVLTELAPGSKGGLAMVDECVYCGAQAYEASVSDRAGANPAGADAIT